NCAAVWVISPNAWIAPATRSNGTTCAADPSSVNEMSAHTTKNPDPASDVARAAVRTDSIRRLMAIWPRTTVAVLTTNSTDTIHVGASVNSLTHTGMPTSRIAYCTPVDARS